MAHKHTGWAWACKHCLGCAAVWRGEIYLNNQTIDAGNLGIPSQYDPVLRSNSYLQRVRPSGPPRGCWKSSAASAWSAARRRKHTAATCVRHGQYAPHVEHSMPKQNRDVSCGWPRYTGRRISCVPPVPPSPCLAVHFTQRQAKTHARRKLVPPCSDWRPQGQPLENLAWCTEIAPAHVLFCLHCPQHPTACSGLQAAEAAACCRAAAYDESVRIHHAPARSMTTREHNVNTMYQGRAYV